MAAKKTEKLPLNNKNFKLKNTNGEKCVKEFLDNICVKEKTEYQVSILNFSFKPCYTQNRFCLKFLY